MGEASLGAAVGARVLGVLELGQSIRPATSAGPGPEPARRPAGGPRRRYCAAILLHCASAACLSEAIGIFAAAVRQACFALLSAVLTFALLVVI